MHEFELIRRYFSSLSQETSFVLLGQGDDSAVFAPAPEHVCVVSTDTLVSGVHFLPNLAPDKLAHRALAVNLSDLAAMGADARAFTLALTLPKTEPAWLATFSAGLARAAQASAVSLMGGDTTRGPLSLTLTVFGELPAGSGLLRSGAHVGDDVWVSGQLGAAWCGLQLCTAAPAWLALDQVARREALRAFDLPVARLALGKALRLAGVSAALDISDGLAGDARHIARASRVSLSIDLDALPVFTPLLAAAPDRATALRCALAGGDDYELLFTAPERCRSTLSEVSKQCDVPLHCIGKVHPQAEKLITYSANDEALAERIQSDVLGGFDHFSGVS